MTNVKNVNVEVNVYDFVDAGVDFGYFVGLTLEGFTVNGETDVQNDDINEAFAEFGFKINYRDIALVNGAYIDSWESTNMGTVDEIFFKDKEDAEFVAKTIQRLFDSILKNL